jgi:hypothetical protein
LHFLRTHLSDELLDTFPHIFGAKLELLRNGLRLRNQGLGIGWSHDFSVRLKLR